MIKIDHVSVQLTLEDTDRGEEFIAEAKLTVAETPLLANLQSIINNLAVILFRNIEDQINERNKEIANWQ